MAISITHELTKGFTEGISLVVVVVIAYVVMVCSTKEYLENKYFRPQIKIWA